MNKSNEEIIEELIKVMKDSGMVFITESRNSRTSEIDEGDYVIDGTVYLPHVIDYFKKLYEI